MRLYFVSTGYHWVWKYLGLTVACGTTRDGILEDGSGYGSADKVGDNLIGLGLGRVLVSVTESAAEIFVGLLLVPYVSLS